MLRSASSFSGEQTDLVAERSMGSRRFAAVECLLREPISQNILPPCIAEPPVAGRSERLAS